MNRKVSGKRRIAKVLSLFFAIMMLVSAIGYKTVSAEDAKKVKYFVVEKKWENDLEGNRPDSITIHIVGSDGKSTTETITKEDGWKKLIARPAYDDDNNEINYSIYEDESGLEKYKLSNGKENPLTVKSIVGDDLDNMKEVTNYQVRNTGLESAPKGNVLIDNKLNMSDAKIEMDESIFTYGESYKIYGDVETYTNTLPRIVYTGNLVTGENKLSGKDIVLTWSEKASNIFTEETYDLRITLSNISIYSLVDVDNSTELKKYVAILANNNNYLHMQAYVGPDFDTVNPLANVVGLRADINIEVLKDGALVDGYTQIEAVDLDQPDYYNMFKENGDNTLYSSYFGANREFIESVTIKEGVVSDIYLNNPSYLEYVKDAGNGTIKFASAEMPDSDEAKTSLKCLVKTDGFKYTWAGSNCGTAIIAEGTVTDPDTFSNEITNVSSFYQIKYFYQKDDGTYDEKNPDYTDPVTMIAPETALTVKKNADLNPKKEGYVLDTGKTKVDEEKTTKTTDTYSDPLILNVYFKKQYRVIYHDNVGDIVWDPADQTNPNLDYGVATPDYDTDLKNPGIQGGKPYRQGYEFLGWSEKPESEIKDVPATVTKNADYWAHWKPAINKYKVEYYYEVDGKYPSTPDFSSADRSAYTEDLVSVTEEDKVPQKPYYVLSGDMTAEWKGVVLPDGSLVLKVYFRAVPKPVSPKYEAPVTGVEKRR